MIWGIGHRLLVLAGCFFWSLRRKVWINCVGLYSFSLVLLSSIAEKAIDEEVGELTAEILNVLCSVTMYRLQFQCWFLRLDSCLR